MAASRNRREGVTLGGMVGLRWAVLGCCAGVALLLSACGTPAPSPNASVSAAPTESPAPTSTPPPEASGACFPLGLAFSLESRPQDSGAGSFYWNLLVTNTSDSVCTVEGYPTIVLLDASGDPLGAPSGHETSAGAGPAEVPLAPGASAYSLLHLTQAGAHGCPLAPVTEVAVTPPDGGAAQPVSTPNPIEGCDDTTTQLVRVGPLTPSPVSY